MSVHSSKFEVFHTGGEGWLWPPCRIIVSFAHYNYCLIALPIPKRKLGKADRETSAEISLSGLSFHAFVAGFCFWLFLL